MSNIYGGRGLEISSGIGAEVKDSSGKYYIDFLCGNGSELFGHCHPALMKAAHEALNYPWTCSPGLQNTARDGFRKILSGLMQNGKVFLCNSGTEAIEASIKLAISISAERGKRKKIIALRRAFHGRTMGALAMTFNPVYKKSWSEFLIPVQHVKMEEAADAIDNDTAFVIAEPMQGEGGVFPMSEVIARNITEKCKRTGTLIIADEIQSGWGRCGAILASHDIGLEPDIVALAKGIAGGLPIGVVVWKGEIGDFPARGHGSTYGGNPVCASVGIASWQLLLQEKLPDRAVTNGNTFVSMLREINSPFITEIRHKGLLIGVELTLKSEPVVKALQDKGVLALPAGPQVLRFLPPFVAEERHFREVTQILKNTLEEIEP
ncbi:MAG: aminotransferase class III-fold pyridoxal phosphate-dependent enzyme [Synergistaceae bacterium]|nr:aminotransferase class III-fold pyridoxal phosphate-dependent enzyme [Synergistaceae bacterium]